MASVTQLVDYIDELLDVAGCQDYCPNGLQVEGRAEVQSIVCGVTASEELIKGAIDRKADLLLVHHGYFWRGEDMCIVGMKKRRLELLINQNMNLLAYHLPLDIHPTLGNNAQIGARLRIEIEGNLPSPALGNHGTLKGALSPADLSRRLAAAFAREPLHLSSNRKELKRLAWCSGAGQKFIEEAKQVGADAYISGEVSEQTYHFVQENNIDYYAIGHHASERYGVQKLAEALAAEFNIKYEYIDLPNPV